MTRILRLAIILAVLPLALASCAKSLTGGAESPLPDLVSSCDRDGVTVTYAALWLGDAQHFTITAARIGGIAAACNGKDVSLTIDQKSGTRLRQTYPAASLSGTGNAMFLDIPLSDQKLDPAEVVRISVAVGPPPPPTPSPSAK
jgi:hypothetical protein